MQGFHEAKNGTDKAAPVASQESVHLLVAHATKHRLHLRQGDIRTPLLYARVPSTAKVAYVILTKAFECDSDKVNQVWRLKAWLYIVRLDPRRWYGTLHTYLLEVGFGPSPADPCLHILDAGKVLIVVYVDDIKLSGSDDEYMLTIIKKHEERFDTVHLGDATFLLGLGIHRNVNAGTILLPQDAYSEAVLDKFGMADARPAKTPTEVGKGTLLLVLF